MAGVPVQRAGILRTGRFTSKCTRALTLIAGQNSESTTKLNKIGGTEMTQQKNPAAVALGRLGGQATSERKTLAARENAKKGGWPKGRPRKPKAGRGASKVSS